MIAVLTGNASVAGADPRGLGKAAGL